MSIWAMLRRTTEEMIWWILIIGVFTLYFGYVLLRSEDDNTMESSHSRRLSDRPTLCSEVSEFTYGWHCYMNKCEKKHVRCSEIGFLDSLNVCKLTCQKYATLWPLPTGETDISPLISRLDISNISFYTSLPDLNYDEDIYANVATLNTLVDDLKSYLDSNIKSVSQPPASNGDSYGSLPVVINIFIDKAGVRMVSSTVESYRLAVRSLNSKISVYIRAETYFGARHAAETLTQLIVYDHFSDSVVIPQTVSISDRPVYAYRGVLLDTARHHFPVSSIKRVMDGMAANKLNTLHWHITDTQSFPLMFTRYPVSLLASSGSYGTDKIYSTDDVNEIIEHGRKRGIRVIPEVASPGRVGEGWRALDTSGEDVLCFDRSSPSKYCNGLPCGYLNPVSEGVFAVLKIIYEELIDLFSDTDMIHLGWDDIEYACWNESLLVRNWMKDRNISANSNGFLKVWSYFSLRVKNILEGSIRELPKLIIRSSDLTRSTEGEFLDPNKFVIQSHFPSEVANLDDLAERGYQIILSNYDVFHLDCGLGNIFEEGTNWCSPFIEWKKIYAFNPKNEFKNATSDAILGAEAIVWSTQIDEHTVDTQLWPRASAMAERLWSDPNTDWKDAVFRLSSQIDRMRLRNIPAESIGPQWCVQNDGKCY